MRDLEESDQPWPPGRATDRIREIARDDGCSITFTMHASKRIEERGLIMSDVLWVLREGFVQDPAEESTVKGLCKYAVRGRPPNSQGRVIRVIAIPSAMDNGIKIVTVMWESRQ